jgi:4-amino-4-deoxy-L-arabinose transferase-like glycosyltransferase
VTTLPLSRSGEQPAPPSTRFSKWRPVVLILLVTLIALPILTYPLGRDQGEFATIGRGLTQGKIPYVDLWNPKPPAVFYIYAGAMTLFGKSAEALRAIDLLIMPVIMAAVYWLGARVANVGLWAALLTGVFYFTETFWTLTQNDGIALLPMTLAMVCMFKAAEAGRRAAPWALAAGALCAWTVWFKYPFALFVAALALGYMWLQRKGARAQGREDGFIKVSSAFIAGLLLVGLGGVFYLSGIGAWDALVQSAQVTAGYTALSFEPREFLSAMALAAQYRLSHWGLLFALVVVGAVALLRIPHLPPDTKVSGFRKDKPTEGARGYILPILLWLFAGLGIMLAQGKGYDYHWLPMLPPLSILAGFGLEFLVHFVVQCMSFQSARRVVDGLVAVGLLLILAVVIWSRALPYLIGAEDQVTYFSHFQAGEFVADESLQMADFLRQRVVPGDSLFIWGFRPEVYYLSQLNPAVRFIFQFPLVADWYPIEWRQETVDILWAALPPYVLVMQVDYMPWVTGSHDDSHTLLQQYEALNDWLIYNYERDAQIGNFLIWRRTS